MADRCQPPRSRSGMIGLAGKGARRAAGPLHAARRGPDGAGMRQLGCADPTDLEILQVLAERPDQPRSGDAVAAQLGLPAARLPVRLASLVSLGYVDSLLLGP